MDWNLKVNDGWTGGQKKNLQRMLNTFGFTDRAGNDLKEDGIIGPKTTAAIQKLNQYQSEARTPSSETRELQKQLNDFGFTDAAGKSLKEDGIYGPKTDATSNDFENNFLDGVTDGKNQAKTVQKNIYPSLPQITQKDVESVITPKAATVKDPMAGQKNADGTWKQVAAPGAWSGSGGTSAKEKEYLENARIAQVITAQIKAGRTQGGYQETGGAQSQAYQRNVPGSTYDKTQKGTYTNWTETGGTQSQATTAPSTGNEGFDMLLGKGKYTGVYNNSNRPSDTIILAKILESANLPKSANMMYNEDDQEKNTGSLGGINTLSASRTSTAQNNQKNADGTWKQVAAPGAWSGSGGTSANEQARPVLVSDINALGEQLRDNGGVDLSDPANKDAVRVVQKLTGLPEDGEWTPTVMNRLQDYLASEFDQFDGNTHQLTPKNLQTLKDIYWSDFYKKQDETKAQAESYGVSGGGFGGGGGKPTDVKENAGKYENDIWRQAGYKGYFDGEWYNDEDKVLKFADVLLDETKLNGGLNLRDLQDNKVKMELFETLVLNAAGQDDNLVNDLDDLFALAHYNNWGDINQFNVTPEQLEALIEHYRNVPKLNDAQRPAVRGIGVVLPIIFNLIKAIFGARG